MGDDAAKEKKNVLQRAFKQVNRDCRKFWGYQIVADDDDSEDDDDWTEIKAVTYSSGESDKDAGVVFKQMTKQQQLTHVHTLWRRAKGKAVGGGKIIRRFAELSDEIAMFGATRRIGVEIEEAVEPAFFILMPDNNFRMGWNLVTVTLLLYTASFVPYRTSFIDDAPPGLETWEWVVNALFMFDIVINFISAYENSDKNIEVRLKLIAKTYITSWFFFDCLAVFPFQLFEG